MSSPRCHPHHRPEVLRHAFSPGNDIPSAPLPIRPLRTYLTCLHVIQMATAEIGPAILIGRKRGNVRPNALNLTAYRKPLTKGPTSECPHDPAPSHTHHSMACKTPTIASWYTSLAGSRTRRGAGYASDGRAFQSCKGLLVLESVQTGCEGLRTE